MKTLTFNDFYTELHTNYKLNLKDLASQTGLSISMLSKLKNGKVKLTNKIHKLFFDLYDVDLIETNALTITQDKLSLLEEKNRKLKADIKFVEDANLFYENKLQLINAILNKPLGYFTDKRTNTLLEIFNKIAQKD